MSVDRWLRIVAAVLEFVRVSFAAAVRGVVAQRRALPVLAASLALVPATALGADFASPAYNVLPPGEDGGLAFTSNSTSQIPLYDGLTPLGANVTASDLSAYFKSEQFGVGGAVVRTESTGRPGLTILRDSFDVPHVYGRTRDDVMFGSGWVAAEDRGLLMEEARGPARVAALDVPG